MANQWLDKIINLRIIKGPDIRVAGWVFGPLAIHSPGQGPPVDGILAISHIRTGCLLARLMTDEMLMEDGFQRVCDAVEDLVDKIDWDKMITHISEDGLRMMADPEVGKKYVGILKSHGLFTL